MIVSETADFWGTAVPTWLAAIGGIAAAIVAVAGYLASIRNRKGLNTLRDGVSQSLPVDSDDQPPPPDADAPENESVYTPPQDPITRRGRWRANQVDRNRLYAINDASYVCILTGFRDVTPDGDGAASILIDLPVTVVPGAGVPFRIDKSLVSPSVTAVELQWQAEGSKRSYLTTLYI